MSTNAVTVYEAKHPERIRQWVVERARNYDQFVTDCRRLCEEFGIDMDQLIAFHGGFGHSNPIIPSGFRPESVHELPEGFRYDKKQGKAVPAKRTDEGKAWERRLSSAGFRPGSVPGFPQTVHGYKASSSDQGYFTAPVVEEHDGTVFAVLGVIADDPVDEDVWTPVKLSQYHLARELEESADNTSAAQS